MVAGEEKNLFSTKKNNQITVSDQVNYRDQYPLVVFVTILGVFSLNCITQMM